jgi:hypothetical protein
MAFPQLIGGEGIVPFDALQESLGFSRVGPHQSTSHQTRQMQIGSEPVVLAATFVVMAILEKTRET